MAGLIEKAIPTDIEAIDYLKLHGQGNLPISASYAKQLYPKYIKDKKNFICPTENCNAPVTCRSIKHDSQNSPTFQNQITSCDMHIKECPKRPNYAENSSVNNKESNKKYSLNKKDNFVSELIVGRGFVGATKAVKQNKSEQYNQNSTTNRKNSGQNRGKTSEKKDIREHLKTLQAHVEIYEFDKEIKVFSQSSKKFIPIKFMFKDISKNKLFEDAVKNKHIFIYYGRAYLKKLDNSDKIRVQFINHVSIEGEYLKPSFFLEDSYLENEYSEIYDAFINGNSTEFTIYTTLPFIVKHVDETKYLNLSSFKSEASLFYTEEELKRNIYIANVNKVN